MATDPPQFARTALLATANDSWASWLAGAPRQGARNLHQQATLGEASKAATSRTQQYKAAFRDRQTWPCHSQHLAPARALLAMRRCARSSHADYARTLCTAVPAICRARVVHDCRRTVRVLAHAGFLLAFVWGLVWPWPGSNIAAWEVCCWRSASCSTPCSVRRREAFMRQQERPLWGRVHACSARPPRCALLAPAPAARSPTDSHAHKARARHLTPLRHQSQPPTPTR